MHTHASKLSGGERKLVALGRAMILKPKSYCWMSQRPVFHQSTQPLSCRPTSRSSATRCGRVNGQQRVTAALQVAEWAYVMIGGRVACRTPASELLNDPDIGHLFLGSGVDSRAEAPFPGIEGTRLPTP